MSTHPNIIAAKDARIAELEAEVERLRRLVMAQSRAIHSPKALSRTGAVKVEGPAIKEFRRIFNTTRFTTDIRYQPELIAAVLDEISSLSALSPAPEAQQEPVAWRWRTIDAETWVYDPSTEWLQAHGRNPNVVVEPLFTRPAEQAVTEAMVERAFRDGIKYATICKVSDIDEAWRTSAVRAALKAAMEARE